MKAIYIAVIAAIILLGIGLAIYMGEKKPKKLDLSSETFGIPINQVDLFNGDYSKVKPPFIVKSMRLEDGIVYNITYPGCSLAVEPVMADSREKDLWLPAVVSIDEEKRNDEVRSECPFKTERGIGIGSTKDEVLLAYGQSNYGLPNLPKELSSRVRPTLRYAEYKGSAYWCLIFFLDEEDRVMFMSLKYAKTSKKP